MFIYDPRFWAGFGVLLVVSAVYNRMIAEWEKTGEDQGYNALLVVVLCLIILVVLGLYTGPEHALITFAYLFAGGIVCVVGSVRRFQRQRRERDQQDRAKLKGVLGNGNSA
jgi:peptidoglycan/LPS O-acetylase OafA/YrhL